MKIQVEWLKPDDQSQEPTFFSYINENGIWQFSSIYIFDAIWYSEDSTAELIERAKVELARKMSASL